MISLHKKTLALLVSCALIAVAAPIASAQTNQGTFRERNYVQVQGYAVHGYAGSTRIGYQWYRTRAEAEEAAAKMRKTQTTNGHYYDRVDVVPETREIYVGNGGNNPPPQNNNVLPNVSRPRVDPGVLRTTPLERLQKQRQGTLAGSETLGGYGAIRFRLYPNGTAQMIDKDGTSQGTWSLSGKGLTLRFYNGSVRYYGTIQGNRISGRASNGRNQWSWNTTIQ